MRIKQKPEDFSVKESNRFDEVPQGRFRVYLMDKQKLSTFEAAERIRERHGLKPGAISYCGLKDKQGRTEQLIAVDGADVDVQDPDLRLKFLGHTDRSLTAANITSNRFSVTLRDVREEDLPQLNVAVAEVNRLGVVNYFDSQRFGSLKHGQGFIAKDLLRGDFEAALHNYMAKPSPLDRTEDAKIKQFWSENWGQWERRVPFAGTKKYHRILQSLRTHPGDWVRAFLQIDADYRAMLLFTYQSYLWNEGVRRYLQLLLPREHLFPMPYQAGTLLFYRDADPEVLKRLRTASFPLLAPDTKMADPVIADAVAWVLGREKLSLEKLRIADAPRLLYFKHEERPLLVVPQKLVVGRVQPDELNRGRLKLNIAFTLPPGAYATLVVKRLYHFAYREESVDEIIAARRGLAPGQREHGQEEAPARRVSGRVWTDAQRLAPATPARARPAVTREQPATPARVRPAVTREEPAPPAGFRARQKLKKEARKVAREQQQAKSAKIQTNPHSRRRERPV
ncbi:MAG: tRNA pseudouridine(13) synthase TruD [Myxococcaceae bacterium]|nr:tRNA pseudouridine(13) synthase TruD [Myxococcaceae bacterium]